MQITKFDFKFPSSIFLFNVGLKLFRLNVPSYFYFDERAYYIPAARDYLQGVFTTNFEQPFLGKLFMAAGIFAFGDNVWGWRIPEVIVGSLGVLFIYLLSKVMFGGRFVQTEKNLFLVLTGVSFGLAIGSKWSGVFLLVFVGGLLYLVSEKGVVSDRA